MTAVRAAFAAHFKAERDRSERALSDITDILCRPMSGEDAVNAIMERLEAHWGRYDDPQRTLAPLGNAVADLPPRTHFERDGCDPPQWHGPTGE
jgi:hypothetical protein